MSGVGRPVTVTDHGAHVFRHYVVESEYLVFTTRKHWIALVEPVGIGLLATLFTFIAVVYFIDTLGDGILFFLIPWLFLVLRSVYEAYEWHYSIFGSTQRRLLYSYGIITHKVAMMPLEKVTDMSFTKSFWGQILGYGKFTMESAGQEQALRVVNYIPNPDATYRVMVATMFGPKDAAPPAPKPEEEMEEDDDYGRELVPVHALPIPAEDYERLSEAELPPSFPPQSRASHTEKIDLSSFADETPPADGTADGAPDGAPEK